MNIVVFAHDCGTQKPPPFGNQRLNTVAGDSFPRFVMRRANDDVGGDGNLVWCVNVMSSVTAMDGVHGRELREAIDLNLQDHFLCRADISR